MPKRYFHDLPIYRLREAPYEVELTKLVTDGLWEATVGERVGSQASHQRYIVGMTDFFLKQYGRWRFNEVIGYIRLYFDRQLVGSEWHFVDRRRISRSRGEGIYASC